MNCKWRWRKWGDCYCCWAAGLRSWKPLIGSDLMVIWKGWFETAPCRATLATPFPALCPRILGTQFTNYGLRVFWGELMMTWKRWFETVPCRANLNTPFSTLCPRSLGTRFTHYGLRVSGFEVIGLILIRCLWCAILSALCRWLTPPTLMCLMTWLTLCVNSLSHLYLRRGSENPPFLANFNRLLANL